MSASHPYRSIPLPRDASFELKPSPGKGWGAFATKRIDRGSMILSEDPLFVIRKATPEITEVDISAAHLKLSTSQKAQFSLLRDNGSKFFTSLRNAMAQNSFDISDGSPANGLFLVHSRFNHSCLPNSQVPAFHGETIRLYATKDIQAGEEISISYLDSKGHTRNERQKLMDFACDCKACLPGTPFQQLSDLRRRLIRGLHCLRRGKDLWNGRVQSPDSPIIVDAKLKTAAENFKIPLSSRLVCCLLTIVLLEEEGVLDDFEVEMMGINVTMTANMFRSEYNQRVVMLAMAQNTWLERLQGVFGLYGRGDLADDDSTQMLQLLSRTLSG
ncbi:hypothetical protein LT330_007808 [Penicillium expansum]|uniref:SET domain-containing protein n=1 Tax=Penicillium expansum TaxID=27334 RepID=A0A0A2JID5_PENEN|nr:hypothetical protein PEX2_029550 [Penicillium expansum]KAK4867067.1 hypothetical protein LT330_007808 [Penicillium expansum]KGO39349.1 hypothetical protein PEXP_044300 [Penicillium expansum]KGO55137.1 hypothetical protein PEX2_029550 [Penicillium expansum]KGO66751.1 hypothetical protein PEX1_070090 [Penicillium expansum]